MPVDSPPWQTVYQQIRAWRLRGTWERATKSLREQGRKAGGRSPTPTVAIIDSQSAKTALKGDGGVTARKKIKGRKRHIAVDTQGNVLTVVVLSAGE